MADELSYEERKLAVRKRLAAQAQTNNKKGFMTPERKKKLTILVREHAKRAIQKEAEENAKKRLEIIHKRCGKPKDVNGLSDDQIVAICKEYYERIKALESEKFDMEKQITLLDTQVEETNIQVSNLRGKFVKPALKKVSTKYDNKFAKLQKKAAEFNFRKNLKTVKKKEFSINEEDSGKTKPEWTKGERPKSFCSEAAPESTKEESASSSSSEDEE